mgnify:CR=1 FL=1
MKLRYTVGLTTLSASLLASTGCTTVQETLPPPAKAKVAERRPNFLLIVADDLGYSDVGAYGGEIATPNMDRLAQDGAMLTNFYTSPFCSPTRAMLMSGTDNHVAGFGDMAELITEAQRGKPGYEGYLNERIVSMPQVLKDGGYRTVMAGKWHLGNGEAQSPAARGFDRSYAMTMGGASHFSDQLGIVAADPQKPPKAIYRENGKEINLPQKDFYSSEAFATRIIDYIEETRGNGSKPFFAYLAFTAPHWPLHAPDEDIQKYEGKYAAGYDQLRAERFERMKRIGLLPDNSPLYAGNAKWPAWDTLTPLQKKSEAKRMAVYAAMVDNMDRQIGRVLQYLEKQGELDNTVVVFMSDNGADGNSVYDVARTREWIHKDMDNSIENTGRPGSFTEYGPGWAQVGQTPFKMYKSFLYEGGISVPAMVWAPKFGVASQRKLQVTHVMDIAPTFYEMAGVQHPGTRHQDRTVAPVQGKSLVAYLKGEVPSVYGPNDVIGWELGGRKALRKGDWKIVYANKPWGEGEWELYNVAQDRVESHNLASSQPEKMKEMLAAWKIYVAQNGVLEIDELANRPGYSNGARYYEDLAIEASQKPQTRKP